MILNKSQEELIVMDPGDVASTSVNVILFLFFSKVRFLDEQLITVKFSIFLNTPIFFTLMSLLSLKPIL